MSFGTRKLTDPATLFPQLTGLPIINPLVAGQPIGSFVFVQLVFSATNTPTTFTIPLGRQPSVVIECGKLQQGQIYANSTDRGSWAIGSIVLRTTVAGTYWMLIA